MPTHVTSNNTQVAGIIPYGSSDESIVYQDALKASSGTVKPTGTGSVSYDTTKGMLLGSGGVMFDLSALDYTSLETAGQISLSVEAKYLADSPVGDSDTTSIGASGEDTSGNTYLMSWAASNATNEAVHGFIYQAASNASFLKGLSADTGLNFSTTDHIDSDYIRLTFSWLNGTARLYVNGAFFKKATFSKDTDYMKYFHVGTRRGADSQKWEHASYVKDLVISNRPVMDVTTDSTTQVSMSPAHPAMATIAFMGDSFANQAFGLMGVPVSGYQNRAASVGAGYLLEKGVGSNWYQHGVSGETITTTGSADIVDQIAGVLASNPSRVVCMGGTNDCNNANGGAYVSADFETDYKSHLTTLLSGFSGKVFIGTVPTLKGSTTNAAHLSAKAVNVADANAIINAMPAWWDAANPSDTGRVVVYDLFAEIGGEAAQDKMLAGLWWDQYDNYQADVHLSSLGRYKFGRLLGKTLFESL